MSIIQQSGTFKPGQRIFLLGFMGTGKTAWGSRWSQRFNMPFLDLDELIEQDAGKSVVDIFEKDGEDFFRVKEAELLRSKCIADGHIIACGGGTPCFYDNMQWMNEQGFTICLTASAPYILKNVLEEKEKRPLVKNINEAELLFFIEQKLKERLSFYHMAKLVLDAENLQEDCLDTILRNAI